MKGVHKRQTFLLSEIQDVKEGNGGTPVHSITREATRGCEPVSRIIEKTKQD